MDIIHRFHKQELNLVSFTGQPSAHDTVDKMSQAALVKRDDGSPSNAACHMLAIKSHSLGCLGHDQVQQSAAEIRSCIGLRRIVSRINGLATETILVCPEMLQGFRTIGLVSTVQNPSNKEFGEPPLQVSPRTVQPKTLEALTMFVVVDPGPCRNTFGVSEIYTFGTAPRMYVAAMQW